MSDLDKTKSAVSQKSDIEHVVLVYITISTIVSMILAVTLILYSTTLWSEFNWLTKTLSNVANPAKSPDSVPFIVGGYYIGSLGVLPLIVYMAYITWTRTNENVAKIGFIFMIIASIAIAVIATFCDSIQFHYTASASFFISLFLAVLLNCMSWIVRKESKKYAIITFVLLLIAGIVWIIDGSFSNFTGLKFWAADAIPEFVSLVSYILILSTYLVKLWKQTPKQNE